jgi:hypothetical protein
MMIVLSHPFAEEALAKGWGTGMFLYRPSEI